MTKTINNSISMKEDLFSRLANMVYTTGPFAGLAISFTNVNQALQTVSLVIGIILGIVGIIVQFRKLKQDNSKKK